MFTLSYIYGLLYTFRDWNGDALVTPIDLLFTVIDLLKGSLFVSIPVFVLVLIGAFLHKKMTKKFKLSWFNTAAIITLLFALVIVSIAFFYPLFYSSQAVSYGPLPIDPDPDADFNANLEFASIAFYRISVVSVALAAMALPFVLMGSLSKDWLKKKKFNNYLCIFASVYLWSMIASILFIFLFGWILQGIIYLLYS